MLAGGLLGRWRDRGDVLNLEGGLGGDCFADDELLQRGPDELALHEEVEGLGRVEVQEVVDHLGEAVARELARHRDRRRSDAVLLRQPGDELARNLNLL